MEATDCAIEGTVICASRADGLVDRIGSPDAERGGIAGTGVTAGTARALAGIAFGCIVSFLATGLVFAAAVLAVGALAGVFLAGTVLAGAFLAAVVLAAGFLAATVLAGGFTALAGAFAAGFLATGLAVLDFAGTTALVFAFAAGLAVLVPAFG